MEPTVITREDRPVIKVRQEDVRKFLQRHHATASMRLLGDDEGGWNLPLTVNGKEEYTNHACVYDNDDVILVVVSHDDEALVFSLVKYITKAGEKWRLAPTLLSVYTPDFIDATALEEIELMAKTLRR